MVRSFTASMALGFFILLGVASADADLISLKADIPFSFKVGETTLPPGQYAFRFDRVELPGVLRVYSQSGRGGVLVQTLKADIPEGTGDEPKLVFEKDGEEYLLSQVLDPGRYGIEVLNPRPRGERERVVLLAN